MGKGQLTHDAILDESVQLASSVGLSGLSVGSLANEMQMSKSGLFAHFRSKEQLQLQTLAHARTMFVDLVVRPSLAVSDGEPRLRALLKHWLDWDDSAFTGGCLFVAAAVDLDDRPGPVRDALTASEREWFELLASVVRSAISSQEFGVLVDPEQVAFEVHALMLGYHHSSRLLSTRSRAAAHTTAALERIIVAARASVPDDVRDRC